MKGLHGMKALVTGGSSGIGQAIAIRLGEEGVDVAINYVGRPEGAEETRDAIEHGVQLCMRQLSASGTKPILVAADVSDAGQVDAMFDEVMQQYGGIDILVNNAGIQIAADTHELAVADFDRVLAVNLRGAFLCAQRAIRDWLDAGRRGSVINVSSVHQVIPKPRFVGYSVSKGGMQNLTHTLALEYAARGIRVNGIGPGTILTELARTAVLGNREAEQKILSRTPIGRMGEPEELKGLALMLASPAASFITGAVITIDGGQFLGEPGGW